MLSGIDVAYEEAFSAAQSLRARMDDALQAVASLPSQASLTTQPNPVTVIKSYGMGTEISADKVAQVEAVDDGAVARSLVGFGSVFTQFEGLWNNKNQQDRKEQGNQGLEDVGANGKQDGGVQQTTRAGQEDSAAPSGYVAGNLRYEELRGELLNAMRAACSSGLELEDNGELGRLLHVQFRQVR